MTTNRHKEIIINAFREISVLEENQFKSRAYLRAIQHLESMSDKEFNERKTFLNLPGIGMSLNTKLMQFKENGTIPAKLFKLREDNKSYLDPQLYKIRKGFISKRIPLFDMDVIADYIENIVYHWIDNENFHFEFLGSYRRKRPYVADLDALILGEEFYIEFIKALKSRPEFQVVVEGPTKTTFRMNNPENTTIDVSWADAKSFPFSVLHFTGSAANNIRMRAKAKELGYKLNQYGLYPESKDKETPSSELFKTEKDIFDFLGLDYLNPENR